VETRVGPKLGFLQPARQRCLGFLRRALRVTVVSNRAKQSQFPAGPEGRRTRGQMRKTNPIFGGRDTPPCHYPIIPPSQSDAYCAKRTQLGRSAATSEGEMCETNPIGLVGCSPGG
jgi:hypothetical protein